MTTYSYQIDISEMELIALERAIEFYLKECDKRIEGGDALAKHHQEMLLGVLAKRYNRPTQTSGNNFWVQYDKNGNPIS